MSGYSVEETEFGVLVTGHGMPVDDLLAMSKVWKKRGLTQMVPGVAVALGALFAIASKKNVPLWIEAVKTGAAKKANGDREIEWLTGPDTGASSRTIFSVLSAAHGMKALRGCGGGPSIPYDPDDFGRCHRLLKAIPEWCQRLGEVAARYPEWTGLVREWAELERLYEEELPKGRAPKLYERMKALRAGASS